MGVEWFRDLSIAVLGLVTSVVLIFIAVLVFRLYRTVKSILLQIKAASKIALDTLTMMEELIKPLLPMLSLVKSIFGGLKGISQMFKKENG